MTLTKRECKELVRLLRLLQEHLESAIESSSDPMPEDARDVFCDRRDLKKIERWIEAFEVASRKVL